MRGAAEEEVVGAPVVVAEAAADVAAAVEEDEVEACPAGTISTRATAHTARVAISATIAQCGMHRVNATHSWKPEAADLAIAADTGMTIPLDLDRHQVWAMPPRQATTAQRHPMLAPLQHTS